jgi:gliding motility-associated-like protein
VYLYTTMWFKLLVCLSCIFLSFQSFATHNRSGEITYKYLYGNTYEFTITTCTKLSSEANRLELEIHFGDGTMDTIPRVTFYDYPATDTKQNYYVGIHTFTGPGTYLIQCEDPNRNANVLNIANSVDKLFCIQSLLTISPFLGHPNNSVQLIDCPCPEETCTGQPWIYNFGAYDPDGDSLSYQLIPCKGENCLDMLMPDEYQYPQLVGGGVLSIDVFTGTLFWNAPQLSGEYNLAVLISEYRRGIRIGYVIRDMQVTVKNLCLNNAPSISSVDDVCLKVNESYDFQAYAQDDPQTAQDQPVLHWEAFGEAFYLPVNPASFDPSPDGNPITGVFHWQPGCEAVRNSPYLFTLEATDAGPNVILKDIQSWKIHVAATPVQNLTLTQAIQAFELDWSMADCPQVIGYRIYKKNDSIALPSENCCAPNAAVTNGFMEIATLLGKENTHFTDSLHLFLGNEYCYVVTALFQNGAESCISNQVCGSIQFTIPILTHASVGITDLQSGIDTIRWTHPTALDLGTFSGPYQYKLYQASTNAPIFTPIFTTAPQTTLSLCDTFLIAPNLNTSNEAHEYKIALLNNGNELGVSPIATTPFLALIPADNQLKLVWNEIVPWENYSYEIWKELPANSGNFNLIASTSEKEFTDSNLVNEVTYCYKIRSIGAYSMPGIMAPLYNWSNQVCGKPTDLTPPCAPNFTTLTQACDSAQNFLVWEKQPNSCATDIVGYRLYFSPNHTENYQVIADFNASSTTFLYHDSTNLGGCYFVTAYDSLPNHNESIASDTLCIENCEINYFLPNVFSPNNDQVNDTFHPILPAKYVGEIDFLVLNRWGNLIFETTNPSIGWDGRDHDSGELVSEGVYTYICSIQTNTLNGPKKITQQGFVHVIYR